MVHDDREFLAYFRDREEYPREKVLADPLPWNVLWDYVAHSLLDGVVNYCKPSKAFLLSRYLRWEGPTEVDGSLHKTHGERVDFLLSNPDSHTRLSKFGDDVLMLGRIDEETVLMQRPDMAGDLAGCRCYIFMWFDMDVSDCSVGRFYTSDSEAEVHRKFEEYCKSRSVEGVREIPLSYFQGWIKL